ncbi:TPA: hypothetical protein OUE28_003465 [Morganella morganii]|nr:hypothetical protein [Morganella morganii]
MKKKSMQCSAVNKKITMIKDEFGVSGIGYSSMLIQADYYCSEGEHCKHSNSSGCIAKKLNKE